MDYEYNKKILFYSDLKDDSELMAEYKEYHAKGKAWPEITQSIKDAGVLDLQIYLTGNSIIFNM